MKSCFEELQHETYLKNLALYLVWFCHSAVLTKLAHFSISAGYFCRDPRKFAYFGTFGGNWACLIMITLNNHRFDTYWPTLLPYWPTLLYIIKISYHEMLHYQFYLSTDLWRIHGHGRFGRVVFPSVDATRSEFSGRIRIKKLFGSASEHWVS